MFSDRRRVALVLGTVLVLALGCAAVLVDRAYASPPPEDVGWLVIINTTNEGTPHARQLQVFLRGDERGPELAPEEGHVFRLVPGPVVVRVESRRGEVTRREFTIRRGEVELWTVGRE